MTTTHTPGPWVMQQQDPWCPRWVLGPEPSNEFLCRMGHGSIPSLDNEEANARLIAAAPDLLEACKAVHREICDVNQWARDRNKPTCSTWAAAEKTLGAAIAKATEPTP